MRWRRGNRLVIANNLANANTTGFKQTRVSFENAMASEMPLGDGLTAIATSVVTDGAINRRREHPRSAPR